MALLRIKEIKAMSAEQRAQKISELRTELSRIRTMISAGGAVENPSRARELRRAIAQVLTIENEEKLGINVAQTEKNASKKAKETKQ